MYIPKTSITQIAIASVLLAAGSFVQAANIFPTDGKVGIGTDAPTANLTITNGDDAQLKLYSNGGSIGILDTVANTDESIGRWLFINPSGGQLSIGSVSRPYAQLHVYSSSLDTIAGSRTDFAKFSTTTVNSDNLEMFMQRVSDGAGWSSAELFLQRKVDAVPMGYLKFGDHSASLGVGARDMIIANEEGNIGIGIVPKTKVDIALEAGRIQFTDTKSSLIEKMGACGAIYFGLDVEIGKNEPVAAIETSWGQNNPMIAIGVSREQNRRAAAVYDYHGNIYFYTLDTERMRLADSGYLGIGTSAPSHLLTVNGAIRAKEVIVDTGWADDVFDSDYALATLPEVETHIKEHGCLPGVPSAKQVEVNGVSVGEAQAILLRKVEELTLHLISMQKENAELRSRVEKLEKPDR